MSSSAGRVPRSAALQTAAAGIALLLAACTPSGSPVVGSSATTAPPGSDAPPGSVTPPGTATPPGWATFTTSDGTLSFDYPPAWEIRNEAGEAALGGEFVDVVNADGKQMAALRTNIVTGQVCTERYPYLEFDSEPIQALAEPGAADAAVPRFIFEARGDVAAAEPSQTTLAAYGITATPAEPGPLACPIFQLFLWPPSGALFGQAYNPAINTTPGDPELPYLEKARLYATTDEYQDIRKMITSLRPAAGP